MSTRGIASIVGALMLLGCQHCNQSPAAAAIVASEEPKPASPEPASDVSTEPATEEQGAAARAQGSDWTLERDEPIGFMLRYRGTKIGNTNFPFWGAIDESGRWGFAGSNDNELDPVGGHERFMVGSPGLGARIVGTVDKSNAGQMAVDFEMQIQRPVRDVVGGGIEFYFDFPEGLVKPPPPRKTRLLDENRGFVVSLGGGQEYRVEFEKSLAKVYLERNDPNRIRCFFISGSVDPGTYENRMTITLPKGGKVVPSMAERFGKPDSSFMPGTVDFRASPVDLSYLNASDRPAGTHGRVTVKGDQLVFEDGTPARFWGTNLMAYALYHTKPEEMRRQAKRMAALGYNLVRLHHHDSHWVRPNAVSQGPVSSGLNEQAMASLDQWIKALHDEGIYIWLDISVQHRFGPGDGIPGFEDIKRHGDNVKGYPFLNERAETVMRQFGDAFMNHRNRATGMLYKDDPAVVGVLVTNENDLVTHGAYVFANPNQNPFHHGLLKKLAAEFASKHGFSEAALLRPWEPGPPPKFYGHLEQTYFDRAFDHLRKQGVKAPLVGTNYWGSGPYDALPSLTSGDLLDVHTYGGEDFLSKDPRGGGNFLIWVAGGSLDGMPVTITEWNTEYPARDRSNTSMYVAAIAALQGWDALMLYGYTQSGFPPGDRAEKWNTLNDPAFMATAPNAALMYRRGDVAPAKKHYRVVLTEKDVYGKRQGPAQSRALRTLMEQSKVTVTLPKIKEIEMQLRPPSKDAIPVHDLQADRIPKGRSFVQSDTGELKRDFEQGVFTVDTSRSKVISGWIGGQPRHVNRFSVNIETPNAVLALSALDDAPIEASTRLLLSTAAQVPADPSPRSVYMAQPVKGTVSVRTGHPKMQLVVLSPQGQERRVVNALSKPEKDEWTHTFTLPHEAQTHWYLLRPVAAAPGQAP